jgi:hypothetical protein
MVAGFSAIVQVSDAAAFAHTALGWFILQILEGSVGQPIARVGQHLSEWVAGVNLADNQVSQHLIALKDRFQSLTQSTVATAQSITDYPLQRVPRCPPSHPSTPAHSTAATVTEMPGNSFGLDVAGHGGPLCRTGLVIVADPWCPDRLASSPLPSRDSWHRSKHWGGGRVGTAIKSIPRE